VASFKVLDIKMETKKQAMTPFFGEEEQFCSNISASTSTTMIPPPTTKFIFCNTFCNKQNNGTQNIKSFTAETHSCHYL